MTMFGKMSGWRVFLKVLALCCGLASTAAATGPAPQILDLSYQPAPFHAGCGIEVRPRLFGGKEAGVVFHCRWFVNGEEIEDQQETLLPGDYFQRSDLVAVEVTPERDGQRGEPVRSGEVEAGNAPPRIVSQPPRQFSPGLYSYAVEAEDADGDLLDFSLEEAPPGMQMDSESGVLTWTVEKWQPGPVAVSVVVEDGYGGRDMQQFTMNLSFQQNKGQTDE